MLAKGLFVRKSREAFRLNLGLMRSIRELVHSVSIGLSTVGDYLPRARTVRLNWPLDDDLNDTRLERLLFPVPNP